MTNLWKSRKFRTMVGDALLSLAAILLTRFLSPDDLNFAMSIVAALQPVIIAVIIGWAWEDASEKSK